MTATNTPSGNSHGPTDASTGLTVIVLGMHRSGTSCLTGLLQQCGLDLGEVVEQAPHNKKGNRENLSIRALNDAILAHSGGSWDCPPQSLIWTDLHRQERANLLRAFSKKAIWGFKDPRTLLTLPFWLGGLKDAPIRFVGTFRHPMAVARSLNARDLNFSIERGLDLWKQYNELLLYYHDLYGFDLVNFDVEPDEYLRSIAVVVRELELSRHFDAKRADFFDESLISQGRIEDMDDHAELLSPVSPIYDKLLSRL